MGLARTEFVCLSLHRGIYHALFWVFDESSRGCTRTRERTQLGQLTQSSHRAIPCHMAPCSAVKAAGRRRKEGCLEQWHLSAQETVRRDEPCFPWSEYLPAFGKQHMNSLFCFACMHSFFFFSLPKTQQAVFISAHELFLFYLSDSLPHPNWAVSDRLHSAELLLG